MQAQTVSREIAGRTLTIGTGTYAKLAHGSVTVQYGDTIIFGAVVRAKPREGLDFFPLQVDYRERRAAAGKFPGGFMKREGRPTTREVLISRLIDRPLRPLFPYGFMDEVQIQLNALTFDNENDTDMLAGIAASAVVAISDIPFITPTAHAKVGRIDGKLILFPTIEQVEASDFEVVVAGTKNFVNMIEVGAYEVPEDDIADAIEFGHKAIVEICGMIEELAAKNPKQKIGDIKAPEQGLLDTVRARVGDKIKAIKGQAGKSDRNAKIKQVQEELLNELAPAVTDPKRRTSRSSPRRPKPGRSVRRSRRSRKRSRVKRSSPASVPMADRSRTSVRSLAK